MTRSIDETTRRQLRDLIIERLDLHWPTFEREHPHLAAAIERTSLIDMSVDRLAEDPAYRAAMAQAARDEHRLDAAEQARQLVDAWLRRTLGLASIER